jgi:hypothetical protein
MILVVVVMAAAAIMSFALLSSASMQAEASRNSVSSYSVDGIDQSGTNLAVYYLMNPDKASKTVMTTDTVNARTFYNPGTNVPAMNLSNGATLNKITVAFASKSGMTTNYTVDVTANASSLSNSLSRTQHSEVQLASRYLVKYAMSSNGSFTLPTSGVSLSIGGNVRCDGGIAGLLSAITGSTIIPQNTAIPAYPTSAVPTYSQLNVCKSLPTYTTANGSTGTAQLLSGSYSAFPTVNASNPDAVYYSNGSLTLNAGTFNGTLCVKSGKDLIINGNGVFINTKKTGQPALVVGGNLVFNGGLALTTRALTVNGLCWLGGNMNATGFLLPTTQFTVNGALMWGGSNPSIDTSSILGSSYVHVNWPSSGTQSMDAPYYDTLYVPLLSDENQTPKSIKLVSSSTH